MSSITWLLPALLSLFVCGVAVFLPKLAVGRLAPLHLIIYHTAFFFLAAVVLLVFYGFTLGRDAGGIALAVAVGAIGTVGQLSFFFALRNGPVTPVLVISSLYPLVSTAAAMMFLGETLSARQWCGVALGIGAIVLAAREPRA
jgi:transporter family protein